MQVSLDKTIELINKIPFFDGFNPEDLNQMAKLASFQKYPAGTTFFVMFKEELNPTLEIIFKYYHL